MIGLVAEIAEDCAAPGIFHYVQRLILVNAKKIKMKCPSSDLAVIQIRKNMILPSDLKWVHEACI